MQKVTKAVIPAAGLGTRFLPITKATPKEMLPIVDKPALQYIIEEIVQAGITDILIITSRYKKSIEDHFDSSPDLDSNLERNKKDDLLKISKDCASLANIHYVRQKEANGLANAVYCAKSFVGQEPFALLLGDDMIYTDHSQKSCIKQLVDNFESTGISTIATMVVPKEEVKMYGNIGFSKKYGRNLIVTDIVEKPTEEEKLSDNVIIGRYVVTGEIFKLIEETKPSKSGEIYFTDSLLKLAKRGELCAYEFEGKRYDTGDKLGYLKANVEYALRDENLSSEFGKYLKEIAKTIK